MLYNYIENKKVILRNVLFFIIHYHIKNYKEKKGMEIWIENDIIMDRINTKDYY